MEAAHAGQQAQAKEDEGQAGNVFIGGKKLHLFCWQERGGHMPGKQRGRPAADNPKSLRVDVRLTPEDLGMLDEYCRREGVSRPQGLRDGIKALNKK